MCEWMFETNSVNSTFKDLKPGGMNTRGVQPDVFNLNRLTEGLRQRRMKARESRRRRRRSGGAEGATPRGVGLQVDI